MVETVIDLLEKIQGALHQEHLIVKDPEVRVLVLCQ